MSSSSEREELVEFLSPEWFVRTLEEVWSSEGSGVKLREITHHLKQVLAQKIEPKKEVWASGLPGRSEYLVDLCVCDRATQWRDYRGLDVVLESEWGGSLDHAWDDLVKVIDMRATARVFVTSLQEAAWLGRDSFLRDAKLVLDAHKHGGDPDWVLIVLCQKGGEESVEYHLVQRRKATKRLMPRK